MKKIVEYSMPKTEFKDLVNFLEKNTNYKAHRYRFMGEGTIDDGVSSNLETNREFSSFKYLDKKYFGEEETVELRVKNEELFGTIEKYFTNQN